MVFDYGNDPKTTPELADLVYRDQKLHNFRQRFSRDLPTFLSGHFSASKYLPFFHPGSFITFLRHPVDRLLSEYAHFKLRNGYTGTLTDFMGLPHMTDRLQHFLDVDLEAFGFIGFMEDYDASLGHLSHWLGVEIPMIRKNLGDYARLEGDIRNEENIAIVSERCQSDVAFYETILREHGHSTCS